MFVAVIVMLKYCKRLAYNLSSIMMLYIKLFGTLNYFSFHADILLGGIQIEIFIRTLM